VEMGGLDFYVDTWARGDTDATRPSSDLEHIRRLLQEKGYRRPEGMMSVRLGHLLDAEKRKERVIIYTGDLAPAGNTASGLQKSGKAYQSWPELEKSLIERAREKVEIERTAER